MRMLVPLLALVSAAGHQESGAAPRAAETPHSALAPVDRLGETWWKERFEAANARIAEGDVDVLFVGDSITQGWKDAGKDVWAEFYGPRKAINLGFSGDRTQHVLWRLERHGLEALSGPDAPRLAVLMIGTNNSNGDDNTAEEIADGIAAVVASLRARLPRTKVLVLAIFPRNATPDAQREKNARASELARRVADGKTVHFLDIGPKLLGADGRLSEDVMPDLLHLSTAGYRLWAEAIEPKVRELLAR